MAAARQLNLALPRGRAAEDAAGSAASLWGLPDFFYRPSIRRSGTGVREIGDGMLIVGNLAAMLQVKSRNVGTDSVERKNRWIHKQTNRAFRQAKGSIRNIRTNQVKLTNARGATANSHGSDATWVGVAILDLDACPTGVRPEPPENGIALLRRDWEFLFDQLKSSHAVVRYLHRVAGEAWELGREPERYFECAAADANAKDSPVDPRVAFPGHRAISAPILPMEPVGSSDTQAQRMYRTLLEDIATMGNAENRESRLAVLASLDHLPSRTRGIAGEFLLRGVRQVFETSEGICWDFHRVAGFGRDHLAFGVCSTPHTPDIQEAFGYWVRLRHHEFCTRYGESDEELTTTGTLLTPAISDTRSWDTTLVVVAGEQKLTREDLAMLYELWKPENKVLSRV